MPTPEEAAVALAEAEASRTMLARGVVVPWFFGAAMGVAIAVRIAATALGLGDIGGWAGWLLPRGWWCSCWSRASSWPGSGG